MKSSLPSRLVLLVTSLAIPAATFAWSSKATPICEKVHQNAIAAVCANYAVPLSPNLVSILQVQQEVVDRDQKAHQSFEHAMTGLEEDDNETVQRKHFIAHTEKFLQDQFAAALRAKADRKSEESFAALGKAIHPLQDATSPAHRLFQAWRYNESWFSMAKHLWRENQYPESSSPEKAELEKTVRWALDIYFERAVLPTRFFTKSGELDFSQYQPKVATASP